MTPRTRFVITVLLLGIALGSLSITRVNPARANDEPHHMHTSAYLPMTLTQDSIPTTSTASQCSGYSTPRWLLESQAWWQDPGVAHLDAAHVHLAACVPVKQTISGILPVDITMKLHNNPAAITMVGATGASQKQMAPGCYYAFIACKVFTPVLRCSTSDCTYTAHLDIPTSWITYDGKQQLRILVIAKQPDGKEMRTGLVWESTLANGNPLKDITLPDPMRATGWQTNVLYQLVNVRILPVAPVSGIWKVMLNAPVGNGDPALVHDHEVLVDPNIHMRDRGLVIREGTGLFKGEVAIDTTKLANGPHKLFFRAGAQGAKGKSSGVLVVPFTVQN
jgi:hypothetical protein